MQEARYELIPAYTPIQHSFGIATCAPKSICSRKLNSVPLSALAFGPESVSGAGVHVRRVGWRGKDLHHRTTDSAFSNVRR